MLAVESDDTASSLMYSPMQKSIPYMQLRGGSSKGVYFRADDLPTDVAARDQILLSAMGRDARQIDGLGGAHPLTSKVAIVSRSNAHDADVDYLFAQVVVGENRVDTAANCGNILAGVGAFAIECGMVQAAEGSTSVRVRMLNSGNRCAVIMQTSRGKVVYHGDAQIDGVPGTAAPVICNYIDIAGSACGSLLPSGNVKDEINGIAVTCIDNGMPVVVVHAADLGKSGYETCEQLNADNDFLHALEQLRLPAGELMNLGDVRNKVIPKMSLVAPPKMGGSVCSRTFIPHTCHAAIGVLGAVSVATACILPGSTAACIANVPDSNPRTVSVEHPSGEFSVTFDLNDNGEVTKVGLLRTTRLLSKGELYIDQTPGQ